MPDENETDKINELKIENIILKSEKSDTNKQYIIFGLIIAAIIIVIYCIIPNMINAAVMASQISECQAEIRELRSIIYGFSKK